MDFLSTETNPEAAASQAQKIMAGEAPVGPEVEAPLPGFIRLPGGYIRGGLGGDTLYDAEVRELTGNDEEYIDRVRRGKPNKLVEAILERGTVSIGDHPAAKQDIRGLLLCDAEKLLIEIRRATYGEALEYEGLTCPGCSEQFDLTIEIDDIPETTLENTDDRYFDVALRSSRVAHVRLPRISDIPELGGDPSTSEYNTALLANVVLSVEDTKSGTKVPVSGSTDSARNLGLSDRSKILTALEKRSVGPNRNKVVFTHDTCGEEVPFPLSVGDLFPGL